MSEIAYEKAQPSCGKGALERCGRLIGEACAMHPNKISDRNTDELHVRIRTAHSCLSTLWDNLKIPLIGDDWNEAEGLVLALRKVIDRAEAALPPKHDPIRAAKAEAWSEGLLTGFDEGQKDAQGIDYTDAKNPYKD